MAFKINSLLVKNFKCFDNSRFYKFDFDTTRNPIVLSGPNGFGKTTFFDAIELFFRRNITRLNLDIENKNKKLGKHILLNEDGHDGILVLNLEDENKNICIVAVINHEQQKLTQNDVESSIKFYKHDGNLEKEELIDAFLKRNNQPIDSLAENGLLNYSSDHFNVYYYVSQAESVHFLKNAVNKRKDSMSAILNTTDVDNIVNYIDEELIGANVKSRSIVNNMIKYTNENIGETVKAIQIKSKALDFINKKTSYSLLISYKDKDEKLSWDNEHIDFSKDEDDSGLKKILSEIDDFHVLSTNIDDYKILKENNKINSLLSNKFILENFLKYYDCFENDVLDTEKLIQRLDIMKKKLSVYNHSKFFRNKYNTEDYNEKDLNELKSLDDYLISFDQLVLSSKIREIQGIQKTMINEEKLLSKFLSARERLHECDINEDSSNCPYCDQSFSDRLELDKAFTILTDELNTKKSNESSYVEAINKEINHMLNIDSKKIFDILGDYKDEDMSLLSKGIVEMANFIKTTDNIAKTQELYTHLNRDNTWVFSDGDEALNRLTQLLRTNIKGYKNPEFEVLLEKHNLSNIYANNINVFEYPQKKLQEKSLVDQKKHYILQLFANEKSPEIIKLKNVLRKEIASLWSLEEARTSFKNISDIYKKTINSYKNQVLTKLRVPLLIYTGKILQDYQNGLGVFISKDEMRFVASGDSDLDILNTFSSGQLSGFVLAFLFAMNKLYTSNMDDLDFILIDDPVQTMDDINIASFIEVLRNDFQDKQIILSTHETDKENYILYKFLKFNQRGQSFNVKNNLYI